MQFVSEHLQRSRSIRDRLRLLSFNSIIEASHLGAKAAAVLSVAKTIKEISGEWAQITERSERAMAEIQTLVNETNKMMETFSDARNGKLREAQVQTVAGLDNLRAAAAFAEKQSREMEAITEKMREKSAEVGGTEGLLDVCSGQIDAIVTQLESLRHDLETDNPSVKDSYDQAVVEQLYSARYTTEMERDVLRAALRGSALPVAQATSDGNSVELF
jgi:DNA repair exonuclease SbcCD ATPase subunit